MKKNMMVLFLFAMMLTFTFGTQASAGYTIYTNKAAWGAAAGSFMKEDFTGDTLNPGISFTYGKDRDSDSVPYINTTDGFFWDRLKQRGDTPAWTTTWHFATPITAFGGKWDLSEWGAGVGITLRSDGNVIGTIRNPFENRFFGFTSTTPFDSVRLVAGKQDAEGSNLEAYTLDNLVYAPVPIPPAVWLLGSGLIGLMGLRRRINV